MPAMTGRSVLVDNGQAVPVTGDSPGGWFNPQTQTQTQPGLDERTRALNLIDFLADYDSQRNPPVYDIRQYDLFLLRAAGIPDIPGVRLSPAADAWLTVDFMDLPPRPEMPEELVPVMGDSAAISPQVRPEVPAPPPAADSEGPPLDDDVPF